MSGASLVSAPGHTLMIISWHLLWMAHSHTARGESVKSSMNSKVVFDKRAARGTPHQEKMLNVHTLALVALLAKAPDELLAVGAVRGLAEETRHKLVAVDLVDLLALEGTATLGRRLGLDEVAIRCGV